MKVLNELSVKDLRLNKKRSIVIIIGIILSTALICGVAGLITSFQRTFVETAKNILWWRTNQKNRWSRTNNWKWNC